MNANEAISMVDQAVSTIQANREVHVKLQEAITVLKELIKLKK